MLFEYLDLKKTLKCFIDSMFGDGRGLDSGWLEKFRMKMDTLNLYGRIVTKKSKGCSYFYGLLCIKHKADGWTSPELKLLAEMTEFTDNLSYENDDYMNYVRQILKMPYLNRLRQFLL